MIYINELKNEMIGYLMEDTKANWSYEAAAAIADYCEMLEEDSGMLVEFDRDSIRNKFTVHDIDSLESEYGHLKSDQDDDIIDAMLDSMPLTITKLSDGKYLIGIES
jgi:hypothetical protein